MNDGSSNRGQNNKPNKKGYNKNNPNDKLIGNNDQSRPYYRTRKHRNYPKNGKDDFNQNTNPNYKKNKKNKRDDYPYSENNSNLYQNTKSSNEDYYEQQNQTQKFPNNQEQINNIKNMNNLINEENKNNNENNDIQSQMQNQTGVSYGFINNNQNININNTNLNNSTNKNYSMYISPSLLNLTNNLNKNVSLQDNNQNKIIKDTSNISDNLNTYTNPNINQINYQPNNSMNNNYTSGDNYNLQQIYMNNIYPQNMNTKSPSYNLNNLNNANILGNNNMKPFQNYNNINSIDNMNYINNMQNNRNKMQNIVPQIYEQGQKQQILNPNSNPIQNLNYDMNNKLNMNLNNNQAYQNRMFNKNNIINNYSPLANQNIFPQSPNLQNLNYQGPKLIKNKTMNMTGGMTLSAQSAKNTIPNYNINAMDNLNVNNMYMQNIPSKFNSQGIPILVNNMTDRSNHPNIPNNLINNAHNNFMMKNNQINCQHNKFYKYGGKKKEFNNPNKLRNQNNIDNTNVDFKQKNKGINILRLNLKKDGKIINLDIYSNNPAEILTKIKLELCLNDDFLKLIFDKIRKAIFYSKEIFNANLNFYSYKELSNIFKKNEKKIQGYITRNRKSKSVTGKYLINRLQNNDIKLYLCDYKKFANLNNSF